MVKKSEKMIKITLIKSSIGRPERQKNTLIGLGLTRMNKTVIRQDTNAIRGMANKVAHLVSIDVI